ncbi:unnamed protein product [Rotaria sp. Silwood1]|nr:unnamed protein product [Rotaria sp. Silwood1]CAF4925727.1 unnamed protein product [Rotaria sp. Silwood1]
MFMSTPYFCFILVPLRASTVDIHPNATWSTNSIAVVEGNGQGSGTNQLHYPCGLYVDEDLTIYVADNYNHRIVEWKSGATNGKVVAGGNGDHQLNGPTDQDIVVASGQEQGNNLKQLDHPKGVVVDQLDTVYVTDAGDNRIIRWPKLATQETVIIGGNDEGAQANQIWNPIGKLRTVILDFIDRYTEVTWDDLVQYFHCMLNLHSLEVINSHDRFFSASDWQMLFETSLPLLTFFTLKIRAARLSQLGLDNIHRTLLSFQTSFWIEKTNFNIFVMMSKYFDIVIFNYQPIDPRQHPLDNGSNSEIEQGTIQFWIVPERFNSDNRCLTNVITSLRLSAMDPLPPSHYYFDNVTCLKVDYLNACLFEWITTHIRLSKITKLIIQRAEIGCPSATSLISLTENLSSLQINFCQWIFQQHDLTKTNHNMKRLYISLDFSYNEKTFRKNDICIIANIFPGIEHLKIDTIDFDCVPFLFACFSRLHSITFKILDLVFSSSNDSKEQQWENRLRSIPKLAFKRTREWITIWLDDLTLQDSNWRSFSLESQFSRCISS